MIIKRWMQVPLVGAERKTSQFLQAQFFLGGKRGSGGCLAIPEPIGGGRPPGGSAFEVYDPALAVSGAGRG